MRLSSLTALVASVGILFVGGTARASFVAYSLTGVDISASTLDSNGLPISTQVVPGLLPHNFTLGDNQSSTFGLFSIWTTDNSIDGNDQTARSITATLTFATPPAGGSSGTLSGMTAGIFGVVSYGEVTWNGPVTVDYGTGSYSIALSNERFNAGFFGLDGGQYYGATVEATVTQLSSPSQQQQSITTPEPATIISLGAGIACLFGYRFRPRRRAIATA